MNPEGVPQSELETSQLVRTELLFRTNHKNLSITHLKHTSLLQTSEQDSLRTKTYTLGYCSMTIFWKRKENLSLKYPLVLTSYHDWKRQLKITLKDCVT